METIGIDKSLERFFGSTASPKALKAGAVWRGPVESSQQMALGC